MAFSNLGYGAFNAYGSRKLTETSPVQSLVEPLSLSEVKSYLKVPERSPTDPAEDLLIRSMIVAARSRAETEQARDLVRKQIDLYFDYWPSYQIELGAPLISVDLVQYHDSDGNLTMLAEDVDYIVDAAKEPGILTPLYNKTWPAFTPWPSSAILVRFTSGYSPDSAWWSGDMGAQVKNGMLLQISLWFAVRIPEDSEEQSRNAIDHLLSYGGRKRTR
jgi:uncharacterized phiE125 gp8 family phage protein